MADLSVSVLSRIDAVDAALWDACGDGGDPFTSHRFLSALETSGSVGEGTGWHPSHLVERAAGQVVGVAPASLKTLCQGEYIFNHGWAEAFHLAGVK